MTVLVTLWLASAAHAGFWQNLCQREIQFDSSQFDVASTAWMVDKAERLQIKEMWGTILDWEKEEIQALRRSLITRKLFGPDADLVRMAEAQGLSLEGVRN